MVVRNILFDFFCLGCMYFEINLFCLVISAVVDPIPAFLGLPDSDTLSQDD